MFQADSLAKKHKLLSKI